MGSTSDHVRASRYRRLALVERDKATAELLNQLAREAELGILFTADHGWRPSAPPRLMQSGGSSRSPSNPGSSRESGFPW